MKYEDLPLAARGGTALLVCSLLITVTALDAQSNDVSQARFRLANYVIDLPAISGFVNRISVAEALGFRMTGQHIQVPAGEQTISVEVETSHGRQNLLTMEVILEVDNDYTLALIGQIAHDSLTPLLINESQIVSQLRDPADPHSYAILVHGISNGPAVDFTMDNERLIEGLAFGNYSAVAVSLAPHDILVTFSDDPNRILFRNDGETPPANDLLLLTAMVGDYPDNIAVTGAVSRLPQRTILDFLRSYEDEQGNTFNILLAAIELANLQEAFTRQDAITLLAPTDAAFMALEAGELTSLFTNPEDLQVLLLAHIIDDIFAIRQLNDPLTLETRAGSSVIFSYADGELRINNKAGVLFGTFPVVTNGNVIGIDHVLPVELANR